MKFCVMYNSVGNINFYTRAAQYPSILLDLLGQTDIYLTLVPPPLCDIIVEI